MSSHDQPAAQGRDEVLAAMAERMNRLDFVRWDRCVRHDNTAVAYGWISRDDGRSDFVLLDFSWGDTEGLDGSTLTWFAVGFSTSSAVYSAIISRLLHGGGEGVEHRDCERVEDVLGALVNWKVTRDGTYA